MCTKRLVVLVCGGVARRPSNKAISIDLICRTSGVRALRAAVQPYGRTAEPLDDCSSTSYTGVVSEDEERNVKPDYNQKTSGRVLDST